MSDIKKGYTFTDKSTDWASNNDTAIRLNKMMDDAKINLVAGTNVTITPTINGPRIDVAGSGTGTVTSIDVDGGTGISVSPAGPITTSGTFTVTNTAPDQTVVLTGSTGITTSGTYPSFTITNSAPDQTVVLTGGTGITTSGTYPSFTVTNTAPDQTVVLTGAGTTAITGTYPNFTVTSNDAYVGTVTSVSATAGTGITVSGSPITSSGTITITNSAPDQTVVLTQGGTTTITGTYPNFSISSADQYTGTVTSVSGAGGGTGLTLSGGPITGSGTLTLGGTLNVANGGTGQTTANDAFNALVPSQASNNGKYLTTNGTNTSWATISSSVSISLANRAALRAYTGAVNNQFIVEQGYYYEGDGGGGIWFFDSTDTVSTDNDGTLVVPGGGYGSAATAGCWHRVGPGAYGHGINNLNSTTLDVRWFGAIPNESDIVTSVNHAFASLNNQPGVKQYGCLYFPSGTYYFGSKVVFDGTNLGNLGITIKGDGPGATTLSYGLTTSDTCMIEIKNFTGGSLQDLSLQWFNYAGVVNSPSVLWIHDTTYFSLLNIQGQNHISTAVNGAAGGVVRLENNTSMTMNGLIFGGSRAGGTQLYFGGGSGTYSNSSFLTGTNSAPCFRMPACNSIQLNNIFFQGGGPLIRQTGASITSNGSYFTVTKTNHLFIAGEYVVISGATYSGYNGRWKIASVPNANTLTITSSLSLSSDTVTINTLPACALFAGVSGQSVTESQMQGCFFNTPSTGPGIGSVGIFLDGWRGNIGQLSIADSLTDYGYTSVFALGRTNSDPGSSLSSVTISNLRQNTGAADDFGFIRLEGVANVTIDGVRDFPGDNIVPGTGKTFNAVVISDGGQAYKTQEITITGGNFTNLNSSALYTSAIINAFVFDGPNVKNVRIINPGVDSSNSGRTYPVSVTKYINGASASNGISVVYADSAGMINLGNASISSGYAVLSIAQADQVKLNPELGYGTSGSVTVRLDLKTSVYIGLTGNTTFDFTGMASGSYIFLTLKNTTGSSITLNWPAINWSSVSTPTSLAAGGSLLMRVFAFGTTYSDTFAAY